MSIDQIGAPTRPDYYNRGGVECIDAIKAATQGLDGYEGYLVGCAIKYLWRWKQKNGIEDLHKAEQCIERLVVKAMLEAPKNPKQADGAKGGGT